MHSINPKAALARFQLLKAMNTVVQSMACDEAAFLWAAQVPQAADDDDLMDIATSDKRFDQVSRLFRSCIQKGGEYGFLPFFNDEGQEVFGAGIVTEQEWQQNAKTAETRLLMKDEVRFE